MSDAPPVRRAPYVVRVVHARPRLFAAGVVGLLVGILLPGHLRTATRFLVGWDAAIALYLVLVYHLMASSAVEGIRARAAMEDEGQLAILVLTVAAALASIGAIIAELGSTGAPGAPRPPAHLLLAMATIISSWAFIHTIFAMHYAHEFYGEDGDGACGLRFPEDDAPDYWDFVYFSFVIGMTSQVSDVAVVQKAIRRTVTAHGIVSFVFNAALVALTVNIAASAI